MAAAALTIASLGGAILPAHADPAVPAARQTVHFEDLDLSTRSGVEVLYSRIQHAAQTLCGPSEVTGTRLVSEEWKDCVNSTVRRTVLTVNRPTLTAYYTQRLRAPAFHASAAIGN